MLSVKRTWTVVSSSTIPTKALSYSGAPVPVIVMLLMVGVPSLAIVTAMVR
jgi:hypothetical protein